MKFWGRLSTDRTRITGAITDITREVVQRNMEKERAIRDNMTGFYNRNALSEVAGKALSECRDGEMVAFVYIGLTGYQEFQERFGMIAGNSYIRVCSEVLQKILNPRLIPFRWLGADFLMLYTGIKDTKLFRREAIGIIKRIQKYVGEVEGIPVSFPVAVGYSISGIDGDVPAIFWSTPPLPSTRFSGEKRKVQIRLTGNVMRKLNGRHFAEPLSRTSLTETN